MSNIEHTVPTFERAGMPVVYDLFVRAVYFPVGGERALRRSAIERLGIGPGVRVLELGCGTGSFTRLFVSAGADVTSMDGSSRMLARAERKAPGAAFEQVDLRAFDPPAGRTFDIVFFGFVLHELPKAARAVLLARAAKCLAPGGRIAIVDHAAPEGGGFAMGWRRLLSALEPPSVRDALEGFEAELRAVDLELAPRASLARGTAQMIVGRRAS
jgi:ubiquinone/menaquinone biosynthesis C-methylase UbiE